MKKNILSALLVLFIVPFLGIGQLHVTITGSNAKCNGSANGSAQANVTGGTAPYQYNWSPSGGSAVNASGLSAGGYTVTVTDFNGNRATDAVTISQPTALVVSIDSIVVNPCFRVQGGGGLCGCGNTLWAIVSGGTGPYSYFWMPDSNTTDTIKDVCYEEFSVNVTDNNGCVTQDSLNVLIPGSNTQGINEVEAESAEVKVYPNPNNGVFQLKITNYELGIENTVEIYNMLGEKVYSSPFITHNSSFIIDLSIQPAGNYLLRLVGPGSQKITRFSISK